MDYTLVFDASARTPPPLMFVPPLFIAAGVVLLTGAGRGLPRFQLRAYLFPAAWTAFATFAAFSTLARFFAENGDGCRVIEGVVENYEATAKRESFSVGGERFSYSDYVVTRVTRVTEASTFGVKSKRLKLVTGEEVRMFGASAKAIS